MNLLDRFWAKVDVGMPDECWTWREGTSQGYGDFFTGVQAGKRQHLGAHVFALAVTTGTYPDGAHALHHCDNRPCCNPAHLYWGSQADNARDRQMRGRARGNKCAVGVLNPRAKFTAVEVRAMRRLAAAGMSGRQLAEMFDTNRSHAHRIVTRQAWSRLDEGAPDAAR